jgi:hypothetical protein
MMIAMFFNAPNLMPVDALRAQARVPARKSATVAPPTGLLTDLHLPLRAL